MNTGLVKKTKTIQIPALPNLTAKKCTKTVTKHFINCALYLEHDKVALFYWLLYQSGADNSFVYNTHLLRRYAKSIGEASKEYVVNNGLKTSLEAARQGVIYLLKHGYIFWLTDAKMIINPMFTYYEYLSRKDYLALSNKYQLADVELIKTLLSEYVELVKSKI